MAALVAALVIVLPLAGCSATFGAPVASTLIGTSTTTRMPTPTPPRLAPRGIKPSRVVTIGDSITVGLGLTPDQAWPTLLARREGWQLTNLGCSGAGFLMVGDADCGGTYSGVIPATQSADPDLILIQGSSNDLDQDNDRLLASTVSMVAALHAALPRATIVGLSAVWNETDEPGQLADIDSQVEQAVTPIGGTYLDVGEPLFGHPEFMQLDDIHPNAQGQLVLSDAIEKALADAGIGS